MGNTTKVKEIISVRLVLQSDRPGNDMYEVKYTARNGLIYWKHVIADSELDAYMRVMGMRK